MRMTFHVRIGLDAPSETVGIEILKGMLSYLASSERKRLLAPNSIRDLDISWTIVRAELRPTSEQSSSPEQTRSVQAPPKSDQG
jgi:hypothetical protein